MLNLAWVSVILTAGCAPIDSVDQVGRRVADQMLETLGAKSHKLVLGVIQAGTQTPVSRNPLCDALLASVADHLENHGGWGGEIQIASGQDPIVQQMVRSVWFNPMPEPETITSYGKQLKVKHDYYVVGQLQQYPDNYHLMMRAFSFFSGKSQSVGLVRFGRNKVFDQLYHATDDEQADAGLVHRRLNQAAETLAGKCLEHPSYPRSNGLKVALGAIKGPGKPVVTEYGNLFGDQFLAALQQQSPDQQQIIAVSRKRLLDVLRAQSVEQSALFDAETVKQIDRAVGADVVVVGDITQLPSGYLRIAVQMVDLESKVIAAEATVDVPGSPGQAELFLPAGEREPLEVDFDLFAMVGGVIMPVEHEKDRELAKVFRQALVL